jgi:hypothetical protein
MTNPKKQNIEITIVEDDDGEQYHLEALLLEVRYTTHLLGRTLEESLLYHPYFKTAEGSGEHREKLRATLVSLWSLYKDLAGEKLGVIEGKESDA